MLTVGLNNFGNKIPSVHYAKENPYFFPFSEMVNCGGHSAIHCAACPEGNGEWWCNGECEWKNGQCIHSHCKYIVIIMYNCPFFHSNSPLHHHSPIHCAACLEGNGEWWCNGECEWKNGQCVHSLLSF